MPSRAGGNGGNDGNAYPSSRLARMRSADRNVAGSGSRLVRRSQKSPGITSQSSWQDRRGTEETFAFILRMRLTVAPDGKSLRQHFSLEDVTAGSIDRFAEFALVADHLSNRIDEIVSGPADGAQH